MALRLGQVLRGGKGKYELLEQLKGSSVFKARVLSNSSIQGEWAVVKSAATNDEKIALKREYRNHKTFEIASCPYIRTLYDTVRSNEDKRNSPCLVFEWMDLDLRSVPANRFRGDPRLPRVVSNAVLSALKLFKMLNAVHTDVNVNNIYVSDIDGPSPIAKLGDLGNLIIEGSTKQRGQSLPCRAPEVWQGLGCQHSSDVWSLGVTVSAHTYLSQRKLIWKLARRLSPQPIFGASDKIIEGFTEAWCIAKIIRLLGPLGQPVDCQTYKEEFELAEQLAVMENPHDGTMLIKKGTLREELQRLSDPSVSPDLLGLIEFLLVVDHSKRPTASEALRHPYLQSLSRCEPGRMKISPFSVPDLLNIVEVLVLRRPLHDNRPVNLNADKQPFALRVRPHRRPSLEDFRVDRAAGLKRADSCRYLAAQRAPYLCEAFHAAVVVDHAHTVVDVRAGHQAPAHCMYQDARWGRPATVRHSQDYNAAAAGAGQVYTHPHDSEDG